MATQIGLFEAKTKLSEIVKKVEAGERVTITVRGRAAVDLVPSQLNAVSRQPNVTEEQRQAAFERLRNPKIHGISHEEIRAAIEEGRR